MPETSDLAVMIEFEKCRLSCSYFINTYCHIYDATNGRWIPFKLWQEQELALRLILSQRLICVLKARQIGLTWLVLAFNLWLMVFNPIATILIFSRRDDDAIYLLSDERLRGMYTHLPKFLQVNSVESSSSHQWSLSNRSNAKAFPTTGGDSYTATSVMVDEADLIPDLNKLLRSTKPTIDAGGKLVLISRADKSNPESEFKKIFKASQRSENGWHSIFLPWYVRPERTKKWYEEQRNDVLSRTGVLDDLYEQYPETAEQALMPRSLDKRIHPEWLLKCYKRTEVIDVGPALPGLQIFVEPNNNGEYVIGADSAEGNPLSDDSTASVLDAGTGEEVALLSGKFEPAVLGNHIRTLSIYYNNAPVLPERNNHGHALILWLADNSNITLLNGIDNKIGWLTSSKSKAMVYDDLAEAAKNVEFTIHSEKVYDQLGTIEGSTLRAPEGMMDDCAISFALAKCAIKLSRQDVLMNQVEVKWG